MNLYIMILIYKKGWIDDRVHQNYVMPMAPIDNTILSVGVFVPMASNLAVVLLFDFIIIAVFLIVVIPFMLQLIKMLSLLKAIGINFSAEKLL
ncbi:MAG: hypothetical protein GX320_09335 [Tissierellia bacterium]|nr:hypothetical protein [Tissierellia bacterium]